ncbi:MAG TPA: methylated-DNA--[protein]-cysteine S-methyltransferase [Nitrospirota bacterium]|nr:methylated-DNA--[protein]-cysteine S-methyltransferase [Nitrospirota bacterium]
MKAYCDMRSVVIRCGFGWVGVAATAEGVRRIILPGKSKKAVAGELSETMYPVQRAKKPRYDPGKILYTAEKLLTAYFSGALVSFDVPLDLRYHTPFRQAVWRAAAEIPYGQTRSYAWIARRIKNPGAVRAVGQALGANPLPLIIP